MRRWVVIAFLTVPLVPSRAMAMGAVVGREGESLGFSVARAAVATAPGRTALWAQVAVSGASGGFVWILPVRAGARIDLASDAWLDALDAATSPVVLPPVVVSAAACDAGAGPAAVPPLTSPQSSRPMATAVFTDSAALGAFVSGAGCALPQGVASALDPLFSSGVAVLASAYASSTLPTRTVRIVDDGLPLLPVALTGTAAGDTPVSAFVIASEAASAGAFPLALPPSSIVWGGDAASTYVSARQSLLESSPGSGWLTESAMPDLLFDGAPIGPSSALPSVVGGYFALASAYGDATGDPAACTAAARATDGGLAADALTCGGSSDDAAVALGLLAASDVWVTRIEGLVRRGSGSDAPVSIQRAAPSSPVVTAFRYEPACAPTPAPAPTAPVPTPPPPVVPVPPPIGPQPSYPVQQPVEDPAPSGQDVGAAVEGCGAIADGCAASSDSSDSSNDGCSSSSSTGDGSTGDDSSGGGSDSSGGCGGSDTSGSSSCATASRARSRARSPASRVLLLLVAAAAFARRRGRAGSAG